MPFGKYTGKVRCESCLAATSTHQIIGTYLTLPILPTVAKDLGKNSATILTFKTFKRKFNPTEAYIAIRHASFCKRRKKRGGWGKKTTAPRIPMWSPSMVLTERHFA